MVIVLSQPDINENEVSLINELFDAGMQLFHLRKPGATDQEVRFILAGIRPEFRNRIVLNQSYFLGEEFGITRFHFSTQKRLDSAHKEWIKEGNILSTSTHSFQEYQTLELCFNYAFISPVFDSISKPDYKKVSFDIDSNTKNDIQLIALGGVDETNCQELIGGKFDGIALLGGIWNNEFPIKTLKKINRLWSTHDQ